MQSNLILVEDLPSVSIVVVGRDEASNLDSCFSAIRNLNYPQEKIELLYVDSQSKDNSIEIARNYTNKIFQETSKWPTAGQAFNKGIIESSHSFIHITAGDIQLHPEYLRRAIEILINKEDIHCVTGYFTEKTKTRWNKILAYRREDDIEADDHYVLAPNGGTFKKNALLTVNGYDERIKKGQETELGIRFKRAGFKIWYLHIPQGVHDFELNNIFDMIKRSYDDGYSLGHLFLLSVYEKNNTNFVSFRRSATRNLIFNGFMLLILTFMTYMGGVQYTLLWFLIYLGFHSLKIFIKQENRTRNYKIYLLVISYFSIFTFFGILAFFSYYLMLRANGTTLLHSRIGLQKLKN